MAADFMARLVPLRNSVSLFCLVLSLIDCQSEKPDTSAIPTVSVSADVPGWQRHDGQLWLNGQPFSGYQHLCTDQGDTVFVATYLHGKAEGLHRQWYPNGQLKEVRHYQNGWQEGEQRGWYESGKQAFVSQFENDVYEGSRKEWYANGKPALDGNYHEGQENGPQRQWFDNGSLKANYESRNGRNYGFTGVKNCVNVWDSITVSH